MRYMMFIIHPEDYRNQTPPQGLMDAMGKFVQEGFANKTLVDTAGLQATDKGARVRLSKGKLQVTDGPFTEAKEIIGGYALVDVESHGKAMEIATRFMDLHRVHWPEFEGMCEVRPLEVFDAPPQR